jgi:hypothetical protein
LPSFIVSEFLIRGSILNVMGERRLIVQIWLAYFWWQNTHQKLRKIGIILIMCPEKREGKSSSQDNGEIQLTSNFFMHPILIRIKQSK